MTPKSMKKTINFDAEDMQKKASIPPCFSTVLGGKTGRTVPKKGEHSAVLFKPFRCEHRRRSTQKIRDNTIQYKKWTWDLLHNFDVQIGGTAQR